MVRAIIFDFNGILVDDEAVHYALFREVLADEGVALDEATYHDRYLGYDDRGCFEAALVDAGRPAPRDRVDALIARKAVRYVEVAEAGLRIFPGASEAIEGLGRRWPLAICSGALRPEIEFALGRIGGRDRVALIVSAEDTARCKPDPEGYLLALEGLRAGPRPGLEARECLVIEDSLAGIEAARAAGMRVVGVAHTYPAGDLEAAGAEAVLDDLAGLTPQWIEATFGGERDG